MPFGDETSTLGIEEGEVGDKIDPDPLELEGLLVRVSMVAAAEVAVESILGTEVDTVEAEEMEVDESSGRDIVQDSCGGEGVDCVWVLLSRSGRSRMGTASR